MSKKPTPKYKKSKSRTKKRHSAWEASVAKYWENKIKLNKCPDCGKMKLSHMICSHCGKYKGRQIIDKDKGKGNVKVVKA